MKITVAKRGKHWVLDWKPPRQKRRRRFFKFQVDAEAERQTLELGVRHNRENWHAMSAAERYDLINIWHEAAAEGLTVRAVWERFKATPKAIDGPPLQTVIAEVKKAKTEAGRRRSYVNTLDCMLRAFAAGRDQVPIGKVTLADVQSFIGSKPLNSRQTIRSRLSTLFKYGIRLGYRADNPCDRLERITVDRPLPKVFTPSDAQTCVLWLKVHWPKALPWFILTTFCGLRPEEADAVTKDYIDFAEGFVRVEFGKLRQRRVVYPKPEAMRLLKSAVKGRKLPLAQVSRRRAVRELRDHLGWPAWPKDITRHSAASYWLADCGSAATVADMLGHTEKTLRSRYKALVTREQAKEFWRIRA